MEKVTVIFDPYAKIPVLVSYPRLFSDYCLTLVDLRLVISI